MRLTVLAPLLAAGILISGCASHRQKAAAVPKGSTLIVTPDTSFTAKVVRYNSVGRYVVLSFPVGQMPAAGQGLFLYRGGLKTGAVRITGPQNDNNIVADVVDGDAQVGDEVRDQ